MVEYKCDRCHKLFDKKHNYDVHINRKNLCKQVSQIYEPENSRNIATHNMPILIN